MPRIQDCLICASHVPFGDHIDFVVTLLKIIKKLGNSIFLFVGPRNKSVYPSSTLRPIGVVQ